jgi:hypothetical protein
MDRRRCGQPPALRNGRGAGAETPSPGPTPGCDLVALGRCQEFAYHALVRTSGENRLDSSDPVRPAVPAARCRDGGKIHGDAAGGASGIGERAPAALAAKFAGFGAAAIKAR